MSILELPRNVLICGNDNDTDHCLQLFAVSTAKTSSVSFALWLLNDSGLRD